MLNLSLTYVLSFFTYRCDEPAPEIKIYNVLNKGFLEELKKIGPQSFTIGGAFFDGSFPGTLVGQIAFVTDFMGGAV